MDCEINARKIEEISKHCATEHTSIELMKKDISDIKSDVSEIKENVKCMMTDYVTKSEYDKDINELKFTVETLKKFRWQLIAGMSVAYTIFQALKDHFIDK